MGYEELSDEKQNLLTSNGVGWDERTEEHLKEICAMNQDNDIIQFYKRIFKFADPTIIDLVGTTGAGKTTFCQQFVDEEGKKVLSKTITTSGNSTKIQTDVVILENTKNRLFLKARTKRSIIRDLILVALNIESEYKFDVKKNITDVVNKAGVKKSNNKGIKVSDNLFQGVYNLFRTSTLLEKFQKIAKDLQQNFTNDDDVQKYIGNNITNENLIRFLDDIIYSKLKINNFYGYRHEISLGQDNILEKTIIPTKTFDKYKERLEEFNEIVSLRLLFEQAIVVLKCDEKAKRSLPDKFKKGVVFRDILGTNKDAEKGSATNFKVIYKILLISAGTGGELVDDKFVEEFKNIIISEPKQSIVVITKIDKASSYVEYTQNNYEAFIESLKEQIVTTHNNLINRSEEKDECNAEQVYKSDENAMDKKLVASFDNAYLSKITKDEQGNYDAELHKIVCENKSNQEISTNDIEDVCIIDNWHTLVSSILEREDRVSYDNKLESDLYRTLSIFLTDFINIYIENYMQNIRPLSKAMTS